MASGGVNHWTRRLDSYDTALLLYQALELQLGVVKVQLQCPVDHSEQSSCQDDALIT